MMNKSGIEVVSLVRDGANTSWGFRLQGGVDHNCPLIIQRVFVGTPSEGFLQRGDVVVKIGKNATSHMSHQDAHALIANHGNQLNLQVHRAAGLSQLQQPVDLEKVIREASSLSTTPLPQSPSPLMFNKLMLDPMEHLPRSPTPGRTLQKEPSYINEGIANTEEVAIHNQPYRSTPLITPSIKIGRDVPCGNYLRHYPVAIQDTNNKPNPQVEMAMKQKVIGSVTRKTSTPEPREINPTYNSPIAMYSQDNVNEVIQDYQAKGFTPTVPQNEPPKKPVKEYNPQESSTYQAVVESEICKPVVEVPAVPPKPFPQPAGNIRKSNPGAEHIAQSASFKRLMAEVALE